MEQSENTKRLKKMLRMAKNFAELSAKLGKLMVREEIPAIEVEGYLVTCEKDRIGNDMAVLSTVDEKFWASFQQAQDDVIIDLLAKGGNDD